MLIVNRRFARLTTQTAMRDADSLTRAAKIAGISIILALSLFLSTSCFAQRPVGEFDTTKTAQLDTLPTYQGKKVITIETYAKRFDPRKALLFAAVLPGSGQVYNKKYWKVPLVYGGFVGSVYVVSAYNKLYTKYKMELFDILNNPGTTVSPQGHTEAQLRSVINTARRQRDFFCAITGLWYILQMVDAHVDAHLKEFDLNPKLQVRLEPTMTSDPFTGRSTGLSLKFRF